MKNLLFIASLFCFCVSALAQVTPVISWQNTFNATNYDYARAIIRSNDGGYLIGGFSASPMGLDKSQNLSGGNTAYDYWVIKTDSGGGKQWDVDFGGSQYDYLTCLLQTDDGGYLIGGYSNSTTSGDKTAYWGSDDYWVLKINGEGNKVWDKVYGGYDDDLLSAIIPATDGGYILAGYSDSDFGGNKSEDSKGRDDYWIVKIDEGGNKIWDRTLGGTDGDRCTSIDKTPDGGYILGGFSWSGADGDKTEPSFGDSYADYWFVKINSTGGKEWDKTYGGFGSEWAYAVKTTDDGGYLMVGKTNSINDGNKESLSFGGYDFWAVKTNGSGDKEWDMSYGGSDWDEAYTLVISNGMYVFGGTSESDISGNKTQNGWGSDDGWIVATDANGVKQWDARYGGIDYDVIWALVATPDSGFAFACQSSSDISGDKNEISYSGDYWLVKLSAPCGLGIYYADEDGDGYGNPAVSNCGELNGYVQDNTDCNDNDPSIYPSAIETCNGLDENCNGVADDGLVFYYADTDGDGYGNAAVKTCIEQPGYVLDKTDCNDANALVYPGSIEVCANGLDDNCNGQTDEGCTCDAPTDLSTTKISATTAVLNWDYSSVAEAFQIQYKVSGSSEWNKFMVIDYKRKTKLEQLIPSTEYVWRIRTRCDEESASAYSEKVFFTTLPLKESSYAGGEITILNIFPNPASNKVTLSLPEIEAASCDIKIFDLLGRTVIVERIIGTDQFQVITLDISILSAGIYMIQLNDGHQTAIAQLEVQK